MHWLIIGITGVTCSGKSTVAKSIVDQITNQKIQFPEHITIGSVKLLKQDDYFHPKTWDKHTWIPELNYINREILSALNMIKMCADLREILSLEYKPYKREDGPIILNFLIIEGFLIFNCPEIRDLCQIKLDVRVSYEICFERRQHRKYNPPNPPGYFEKILWPFYLKNLNEYKDIDNLHVINGEQPGDVCLNEALNCIVKFL